MQKLWKSDDELFDLAQKELFTAVVGDILDKMGLYHQFLPPRIRPIEKEMRVIGRAMTVLEADYFVEIMEGTQKTLTAKPFGLLFEADGLSLDFGQTGHGIAQVFFEIPDALFGHFNGIFELVYGRMDLGLSHTEQPLKNSHV